MRTIMTIASFALLLSACGGESPESTSTSSTSLSGSPAESLSPSPETDSASTANNANTVSNTSTASTASQPAGQTSRGLGSGDPSEGAALFGQPTIAGTPGCVVCHSLEQGVRMVGPSMADAGAAANGAVEGMSAQDYLRQSIVEPDAHIKEDYTPGLMFQDYGDTLSAQQIDDLVAFLMTQT